MAENVWLRYLTDYIEKKKVKWRNLDHLVEKSGVCDGIVRRQMILLLKLKDNSDTIWWIE